ncbi:hypothetical protein [Winogradskyella marina]|nr:hypothetical protein [Winogradskyella marina]
MAVVMFIGSPINVMAVSNKTSEYCEPCNIDSNESNGECFCDAIRLYHAYIRTFDDREMAIEAGARYLDECNAVQF